MHISLFCYGVEVFGVHPPPVCTKPPDARTLTMKLAATIAVFLESHWEVMVGPKVGDHGPVQGFGALLDEHGFPC